MVYARADMESARGVPHVLNDQGSITKVIGFVPRRSDRCCHDGAVFLFANRVVIRVGGRGSLLPPDISRA